MLHSFLNLLSPVRHLQFNISAHPSLQNPLFPYILPLSFTIYLVSSPSPFVQPSCYFQHWTPVIHLHPLISVHLLLSMSCPLPLLHFNILSSSLLLPFLYFTLYVHLSHHAPAFPLSPFLSSPLCASPYFQSFMLPSECYAGSFATLPSFSPTSFPLALLNACLTYTGLSTLEASQRCGTVAFPAFILYPHTSFY